jgi:hypothetical protein
MCVFKILCITTRSHYRPFLAGSLVPLPSQYPPRLTIILSLIHILVFLFFSFFWQCWGLNSGPHAIFLPVLKTP